MSDTLTSRLQAVTTWMIVLCLCASALVVATRLSQTPLEGAAVRAVGASTPPDLPAVELTQEEYLVAADLVCEAFNAEDFVIMPTNLSTLDDYLSVTSSRARQLHDALKQIQLPVGDTRELVLVLEAIEQSAAKLIEAFEATAKDGEVAIEMAFEPSYAQALLAELNAGIHAWRAGLRSCGPRPLERFEMNDVGQPLYSKLR